MNVIEQHEIAEADHRILNPFTNEKLMLLGDVCRLRHELMRRPLRPGGLVLVGEPFWHEPPPEEAFAALECGPDDFTSLSGTLDRFDAAGLELVEMILADGDSWDRYVAAQWWTIDQWVRANRDDPRADEMRGLLVAWRRAHLEYARRYLGWGVFVLR